MLLSEEEALAQPLMPTWNPTTQAALVPCWSVEPTKRQYSLSWTQSAYGSSISVEGDRHLPPCAVLGTVMFSLCSLHHLSSPSCDSKEPKAQAARDKNLDKNPALVALSCAG